MRSGALVHCRRTTVTVLAATLLAGTVLVFPAAPAARADDTGRCTFPSKKYEGRPWALQRVNLDALWAQSKGKGVRVAVIDTGVDVKNPQLSDAVRRLEGQELPAVEERRGREDRARQRAGAPTDTVGHGTRVAGIIAARPAEGTGFVGLAPEATIIPIKQNDAEGNGTAKTLADSIRHAVQAGADVINISQDTANAVEPDPSLKAAVDHALGRQVVVVASAGNDGLGGNVKVTYPASYEGGGRRGAWLRGRPGLGCGGGGGGGGWVGRTGQT
ncbi:hypothetical protein GCM10023238_12810 [Streptomyces heliomycini]